MTDETTRELLAAIQESHERFDALLSNYGDQADEESTFREILADAMHWFNSKHRTYDFTESLIGAFKDFRANRQFLNPKHNGEPVSITRLVERLLEEYRMVAIPWCIDDVAEIRPDLSKAECWHVLQTAKEEHDAELGITCTSLASHADELFPRPRPRRNY